jgi:hypothetical protein
MRLQDVIEDRYAAGTNQDPRDLDVPAHSIEEVTAVYVDKPKRLLAKTVVQ